MTVNVRVATTLEVDIPDEYKVLDVPYDQNPNVPDVMYDQCVAATEKALKEKYGCGCMEIVSIYGTESYNPLIEY